MFNFYRQTLLQLKLCGSDFHKPLWRSEKYGFFSVRKSNLLIDPIANIYMR